MILKLGRTGASPVPSGRPARWKRRAEGPIILGYSSVFETSDARRGAGLDRRGARPTQPPLNRYLAAAHDAEPC